jgi:hypothetical protein
MRQVFSYELVNILCLQAAFGVGKGANTQELTILDGLNGVLKPVRGPSAATGWLANTQYLKHWMRFHSGNTLLQAGTVTWHGCMKYSTEPSKASVLNQSACR